MGNLRQLWHARADQLSCQEVMQRLPSRIRVMRTLYTACCASQSVLTRCCKGPRFIAHEWVYKRLNEAVELEINCIILMQISCIPSISILNAPKAGFKRREHVFLQHASSS